MRSAARSMILLSLLFTPVVFAAEAKSDNAVAASAAPGAESVFKQLTALVGEWKGRFADGREHSVSYRLTAGGSVLVETWALAPGRESLTLYYVDAGELVATHYCPQGNQPRLRWVPTAGSDRLDFVLKDGGNLHVPGGWHQHLMWLKLDGADGFTRSETYVENDSTAEQIAAAEVGAPVVYERVSAH